MTHTIEQRRGIAPRRAAQPRSVPMRSMQVPIACTGRAAPRTFALCAAFPDGVGIESRVLVAGDDS